MFMMQEWADGVLLTGKKAAPPSAKRKQRSNSQESCASPHQLANILGSGGARAQKRPKRPFKAPSAAKPHLAGHQGEASSPFHAIQNCHAVVHPLVHCPELSHRLVDCHARTRTLVCCLALPIYSSTVMWMQWYIRLNAAT